MGVYYHLDDHVGFLGRAVIIAIDGAVLLLAYVMLEAVDSILALPRSVESAALLLTAWAYLGVLKATRFGTAGYRAVGARVVDLRGHPAALWQTTVRGLFLFFGPFNIVFDLLWLTGDPQRQTLRDKVTQTYVIRSGAAPAGRGPITYPTYFIATMSFVFAEVSRPAAPLERDAGG